jgi:hypothetical protein
VVLWIGARVAGVGLEWIPAAQHDALRSRLRTGHEVLDLRGEQLLAFAGNMLELAAGDGRRHLVMSATAAGSLDADQQQRLRLAGVTPLIGAIPTIEKIGGGSVRCMLAEVPVVERAQ